MSASSQSLPFILSLRLYSSFLTSRPGLVTQSMHNIGFGVNTPDIDPVFGPIGNYEISGNLLAL